MEQNKTQRSPKNARINTNKQRLSSLWQPWDSEAKGLACSDDIEMIESLITLKLLRARFELMEYIEKARTIPMRSKKTS